MVDSCPICKSKTENAKEDFSIYSARYYKCINCSHHFVRERPTEKALENFYAKNVHCQSIYTDKDTAKARIEHVALPKAKWLIKQFERIYGKKPKSILDIGAGSGHFVYACRKLGLDADGLEISESGRNFCKENFGFDLINKDFTKEWKSFSDYDIVTFWGVIEHVPYPLAMLKCASDVINGREGLVAASVPRWNSFTTTIQKFNSGMVIRHLDPLAHIHCFSDTSLTMAFKECGLDIKAAWYFGMDFYELIMQMYLIFDDAEIIKKLGRFIPAYQETFDLAKLSDEVTFVGASNPDNLSKYVPNF